MKRLLVVVAVLLLTLSVFGASKTASGDQALVSLSAANATGPGDDFRFVDYRGYTLGSKDLTWTTFFTGSPTAITTNLEGSIDVKYCLDGTIAASGTSLSSSCAGFVASDVGKEVIIDGAGAAGAKLVTKIDSVANGVATVHDAAGTAVSGANFEYGSWYTLDSSTSTTSEMRHVVYKRVEAIRCNIASYTVNSSTNTCTIRNFTN